MKPCNIMLSASGRRVALLRCLMHSLKQLNTLGTVIATDIIKTSAAMHAGTDSIIVPPYRDPQCLATLTQLCKERHIRLIIPTIDTELAFYARHKQDFWDVECQINISSPETISITGDKELTHQWLERHNFPTVQQSSIAGVLQNPTCFSWPLVIKPRGGSSSIGLTIANNIEQVRSRVNEANLIVQTLAPGQEYTVDVYVDKSGKCRCAVPRLRIETRGGEVVKGMTVRNPAVIDLAQRIAEALPGAWGVLNIQIFHDTKTNTLNVIEINPRFGGGYPMSHQAGAPMTQWAIEETLGLPCSAHDNWQDGLVMLRYDDAIFVTRQQAGIASPINPTDS